MEIYTDRHHYSLYTVASALQKSLRRGDAKLAGAMALELFPRYSNYLWKRLFTVSAEDCYGIITKEIVALHEAFLTINKGKKSMNFGGRIFISKAVILLASAKHNRDADLLSNYVYDKDFYHTLEDFEAHIGDYNNEAEIPDYVYDVHTLQGKRSGKTKRDFFIEEQKDLANKEISLFDDIKF